MEKIKWNHQRSALYKSVVIPCIKEKERYHAIGEKLSFEISWHFGLKCVEIHVEEKTSDGGWITWLPGPVVTPNTTIMEHRIRFFWSPDQYADINWLKAVEYIQEEFLLNFILQGVNGNEHVQSELSSSG